MPAEQAGQRQGRPPGQLVFLAVFRRHLEINLLVWDYRMSQEAKQGPLAAQRGMGHLLQVPQRGFTYRAERAVVVYPLQATEEMAATLTQRQHLYSSQLSVGLVALRQQLLVRPAHRVVLASDSKSR